MSYRELRNFSEMLRSLSYPRLISLENFRTPNFQLVAEILAWMLKRYDADYDIPMEIDTEQDRTIFIKTVAQFLAQNARIKVNPKKLYQADGHAVQEMLKVASLLYSATQSNQGGGDDLDESINLSSTTMSITKQLNDLRSSRALAAEITERGASLYDLLGKEAELRGQRTAAIARQLEIRQVENNLKNAIRAVENEIKDTLKNLDNVASDEANLDAKIQKKQADLDRQQKRLAQLQAVRPAYMDEYEQLEEELHNLYAVYVQKFRNIAYMEQMQGEYDRSEADRAMEAENSLRRMAEKIKEEETKRIMAAEKLDGLDLKSLPDDERMSGDEAVGGKARREDLKQPKVYGSMTGGGLSDNDDDDEEESELTDDDEDPELLGAKVRKHPQVEHLSAGHSATRGIRSRETSGHLSIGRPMTGQAGAVRPGSSRHGSGRIGEVGGVPNHQRPPPHMANRMTDESGEMSDDFSDLDDPLGGSVDRRSRPPGGGAAQRLDEDEEDSDDDF